MCQKPSIYRNIDINQEEVHLLASNDWLGTVYQNVHTFITILYKNSQKLYLYNDI